jgi:hypothetical protein
MYIYIYIYIYIYLFLSVAQQPIGCLIFEVSRSQLLDTHAHLVAFLCMSNQLFTEAATYTTQETNVHAFVGFEPAIPAIERPQTYALEHTATGIGRQVNTQLKSLQR